MVGIANHGDQLVLPLALDAADVVAVSIREDLVGDLLLLAGKPWLEQELQRTERTVGEGISQLFQPSTVARDCLLYTSPSPRD